MGLQLPAEVPPHEPVNQFKLFPEPPIADNSIVPASLLQKLLRLVK
jgi:hypothetical protein